ncbi:MAG: NAD-dependent epimerase/dehydratase family protein [Candidatus Thermoplasmatota archaeon]|nr:NAD-dependent epimerase/dehydratase family protein [Candidatus Thermoplasmatota archaeon]
MRVLVTGSSGQLGSYLCELLMRRHDVVGLDTRTQPYAVLKPCSVVGDIQRPGDVRRVLGGVDAVVHCAAQVSVDKSVQDPITDASVNVLGTVSVLHESAKAGVRKFVYISSAAIFGRPKYLPVDEEHPTHPISNYGVSKLAGEKYVLAYANMSRMEVVSVRPFNFYSVRADPQSPYSGVITKFVSRVRSGFPPIIEGDGRQTRDFIHTRDVAEMISLILEKDGLGGQVLNCGSGVSTSVSDLARKAIRASGRDLEPLFATPRIGDIRDSVCNVTKSRELLGFRAKVSLEEGLSELVR